MPRVDSEMRRGASANAGLQRIALTRIAGSIRDKAVAMATYARQADAFEIRVRAERRLGEIMKAQAETFGFNTGGRPKKTGSRADPVKPTLDDAGIDKHLADRARKLNALSNLDFERLVAEGREDVRRSVERAAISKISRQEKHQAIAAKATAVPSVLGPFPCFVYQWRQSHVPPPISLGHVRKGSLPKNLATATSLIVFKDGVFHRFSSPANKRRYRPPSQKTRYRPPFVEMRPARLH